MFLGRVGDDAAGRSVLAGQEPCMHILTLSQQCEEIGCWVAREYVQQLAAPNLQARLSVSDSGAATAACLCLVRSLFGLSRQSIRAMVAKLLRLCRLCSPFQGSVLPAAQHSHKPRVQVSSGGERTMRTYLGAAAELCSEAQLPRGWAAGAALVHAEGYMLYRPAFARAVLRAARQAGALVRLACSTRGTLPRCPFALLIAHLLPVSITLH